MGWRAAAYIGKTENHRPIDVRVSRYIDVNFILLRIENYAVSLGPCTDSCVGGWCSH